MLIQVDIETKTRLDKIRGKLITNSQDGSYNSAVKTALDAYEATIVEAKQ